VVDPEVSKLVCKEAKPADEMVFPNLTCYWMIILVAAQRVQRAEYVSRYAVGVGYVFLSKETRRRSVEGVGGHHWIFIFCSFLQAHEEPYHTTPPFAKPVDWTRPPLFPSPQISFLRFVSFFYPFVTEDP
jgi:hypothetical protein